MLPCLSASLNNSLFWLSIIFVFTSCGIDRYRAPETPTDIQFSMKEDLARLAKLDTFPTNFTLNDQGVAYMLKELDKAPTMHEKEEIYYQLALQEIYAGHNEEAIDKLTRMYAQLKDDELIAHGLLQYIALAYQRMGENNNCRNNHNEASCILPFSEKAVHIDQEGSKKAIEYYLKCLELFPNDMMARWLLNVSAVTLGDQENYVPKEFWVDFDKYKVDYPDGAFKNIASDLGLDNYGFLGGMCVDDFDNDGKFDVFTTSYNLRDNVKYFHNTGSGFEDLTESAGLKGVTSGVNVVQADHNNDGWLDLLIIRGGWMEQAGYQPLSLLENNGDNTFTDVTYRAGLLNYHPCHSATWADVNNDGWLDLFVANENYEDKVGTNYSQLFISNKNGTYTDVTSASGIIVSEYVKGASFADLNNDGWPDLYLSTFGSKNMLFMNQGLGKDGNVKFKELGKKAGVQEPIHSFPIAIADFNNDGFQDIYVSGYGVDEVELASEYIGREAPRNPPKLYLNNGDGTFNDQTASMNLYRSIYAMGLNYGDIDNDGYQDLYAATGNGDLRGLLPNVMLRNAEGWHFDDVTADTRTGHLQKGHGVSFADIDNDGDLDLFVQTGGFVTDDRFWDAVFENPGNPKKHWLKLKLVGTKSNRAALGARVRVVTFTNANKWRSFYYTVSSGASYGANPLELHIGVDNALKVDSVIVDWPTTGQQQVFTKLYINNRWQITEGSDSLILMDSKPINYAPAQPMEHQHHDHMHH